MGSERKYLVDRVGDAAVVQVYADGFAKLPLREKTLIWHLYQAALAGRDIFYDQRYANNLEMRALLEALLVRGDALDATVLAAIRRYTKLFWINTGPFNNLYEGVTMSDLVGYEERFGLNSRLVKRDGVLEEEVYRVGGRYDAYIRRIVGHLHAAIPFACPATADALRALIRFYETGEERD